MIFTWVAYGNFLGYLSYCEVMIRTKDSVCGWNQDCHEYWSTPSNVIADLFGWWFINALLLIPVAIVVLYRGTVSRLRAIAKEEKARRKEAKLNGEVHPIKKIYRDFKKKHCSCFNKCRRLSKSKKLREKEAKKFVKKEMIEVTGRADET